MGEAYYSCPWIEGRLVFAVEKLLLCCVTNHGRGCPKACDFKGGPLPLDRILSFRDEVRRLNQQDGHHPLCTGCGWLEKKTWKKDAYLFNHLTIAHFTVCNLACHYCYVTRGGFIDEPAKPYDVYPILETMIRDRLLSPKGFVFWGGGEPTVFKGFQRSFELLLDYGVEQGVSTNATVMSDVLKEALVRRKVNLVCSVDAGTPETYRKIKNRDYFDRVWCNIKEYVSTGGRVDAKIIVMQENHREVIPFLDKAKRAGIRNVIFDVNFHDQEQSEEILDAIASIYYEGVLNRGMQIIEGGSGVPAYGETLRARIRERLDKQVTWDDVVRFQKIVRDARSVRFSRELKKYPFLRRILLRGFDRIERIYRRVRPGFY